jgi:hypothetical protein
MSRNQATSPPSTRRVLRSLISFYFEGISEYLEYLLAQIDAPMLRTMSATFRDIITHIPQLFRFTNCAARLSPPIRAVLEFDSWRALLKFIPSDWLELAIIRQGFVPISSMALVCRELFPLVSSVERLDLHCKRFLLYLNCGSFSWRNSKKIWMRRTIQSFIATHKFSNHPVVVQQMHCVGLQSAYFGQWKQHRWHAWVNG